MDSQSEFSGPIAEVVKSILLGHHTATIAQVEKFDKGPPARVELQIVIKRRYQGEAEAKEIKPLVSVPIVYAGSGDFWSRFPLEKGSAVLVVFAERSIHDWLDQGGIVDPTKKRAFDLSDAIAIPGLFADPDNDLEVPDEGVQMGSKDGSISMLVNSDGIISRVGNMDFEITTTGAKARSTLPVPILADVEAYTPVGPPPGFVSLATHTHLSSAPGVASGPPIPIPEP